MRRFGATPLFCFLSPPIDKSLDMMSPGPAGFHNILKGKYIDTNEPKHAFQPGPIQTVTEEEEGHAERCLLYIILSM